MLEYVGATAFVGQPHPHDLVEAPWGKRGTRATAPSPRRLTVPHHLLLVRAEVLAGVPFSAWDASS